MTGTLYLIATPIGNLGDLSPRAVQTIESADFVAAEDTRVSLKLLNHFGIRKPLVCYMEHNKASSGDRLLERLMAGETCALMSDAGMPAISDPGEDIVRQCAQRDIPVICIPGPCACVTALALSGLSTRRFCFEGFLSVNTKDRRDHLESLKGEKRTMVFYEAPHKLQRTLKDLLENFGDRKISLCRELTKIHEEVIRTTLSEAVARYEETPPKGEFVLVVEGAPETEEKQCTLEEALALVQALVDGGLPRKEACKKVGADTGFSKNELYSASL